VSITYEKSAEAAAEVVNAIKAMGRRAIAIQADSADAAAVQASVEKTVAELGGLDILVNNAGILRLSPVKDISLDDINALLHVNVRAPIVASKAAIPYLGKGGRIINIGSVTSVAGYAGLAPYGASRGGIRQLTMSLADDWGKHGITVNCLAPGWFHTEQNKALYEDKEWVNYLCERIPARRPGDPNDLDGAIVFLASESSRYITGQTILVDGGISTGGLRAIAKGNVPEGDV